MVNLKFWEWEELTATSEDMLTAALLKQKNHKYNTKSSEMSEELFVRFVWDLDDESEWVCFLFNVNLYILFAGCGTGSAAF